MAVPVGRLLGFLPRPPKYAYDWQGLEALGPLSDWIRRMRKTPQNPLWHGEGDVWAHTRRVCEALAGLAAFRAMPDVPRDALALAALLHDIGKAVCTRQEDGAWVSPHHGPVGAKLARALLWQEFGLCGTPEALRLREAVCLMVRYHTKPPYLIEEARDAQLVLKLAANGELAPLFTWRALCLLAEADVLGRIAPDGEEYLERIEMARELARESSCLDGPRSFGSGRTLRALFTGASVWPDQALYDDTWGEVVLLCGLPGVGKDTWIGAHCPGMPVVCLDDIRVQLGVSPREDQHPVLRAAQEQAKECLRARRPFVWNATSLPELYRARQIGLFERYNARVRVVYLETEWDENLRRNAGRAAAVPEDVIHGMLGRLEVPERFEAQDVAWRCV